MWMLIYFRLRKIMGFSDEDSDQKLAWSIGYGAKKTTGVSWMLEYSGLSWSVVSTRDKSIYSVDELNRQLIDVWYGL